MDSCVKITFTGDIMCKQQMLSQALQNGKYDFNYMFQDVRELFSKSDFVVGNLETPISKDNSNLVHDKYIFNAPSEFGYALKKNLFDCVSLANNHCLDRGIEGLLSTNDFLEEIGLYTLGINKSPTLLPKTKILKNIKFGFLSYTYGTNADENGVYLNKDNRWVVNQIQKQELSNPIERYCVKNYKKFFPRCYNKLWRIFHPILKKRSLCERRQTSFWEINRLKQEIKLIKKEKPDFLIMCLHIGGQYNDSPTQYTLKMLNWLWKRNVNVIITNHEHIVQNCNCSRLDDNLFATYCLGNFLGIGGILQEPYDKLVNYSIACHIYFDIKNIKKITYSILKTVYNNENKMIKTVNTSDYFKELGIEENEILWDDVKKIALRFSGKEIFDYQEEYLLYEKQ